MSATFCFVAPTIETRRAIFRAITPTMGTRGTVFQTSGATSCTSVPEIKGGKGADGDLYYRGTRAVPRIPLLHSACSFLYIPLPTLKGCIDASQSALHPQVHEEKMLPCHPFRVSRWPGCLRVYGLRPSSDTLFRVSLWPGCLRVHGLRPSSDTLGW